MNVWEPVQIDNITDKSLEGLVAIEVCTNYSKTVGKTIKVKPKKNIYNKKQDQQTKKVHNKSRKKQIKQNRIKTPFKSFINPSRQGCTDDKYNKDLETSSNQTTTPENHINLETVKSWTNLPLQESLLKALAYLKFTEPTHIQSFTLPPAILGKRDILGAAETGSGKTLAFGLPILYGILKLKENLKLSPNIINNEWEMNIDEIETMKDEINNSGIGLVKAIDNIEIPELKSRKPLYALILTPTRELAIQVKQHLSALAKFTNISTAVVVGGMSVEKQLRVLNNAPEIVVATPGRLWELIEEGNPHLSQINNIKFLAIDETDRMVEKGHFIELHKILERINLDEVASQRRQNFVFSATLTLIHELPKYLITKKKFKMKNKISDMTPTQKLQKIAEVLNIKNPKVVDITLGKGTSQTLTECKITCEINEKDYYVYYFLMKHPGRTLIFCNSIGCVRRLLTILSLLNCNPVALHSSLQQRQRLKNLDKFKENANSVLIATDVAARGLDISGIQHVIHYQTPRTSESYVHRSGRTARASNEGITILLVEPGELQNYLRLCRTLGKTKDLPLFPIQGSYLTAIKERVNLARELDKLELIVKKTNSEVGWMQKAADEMDMIIDDHLNKHDKSELQLNRKAAEIKRKQLSALLQKPVFPKDVEYSLSSGSLNNLDQNKQTNNAIEVMKNALKTNAAKYSIKVKHPFKPKIRKDVDGLNLKSFLKKKNKNSKPNFKKTTKKNK